MLTYRSVILSLCLLLAASFPAHANEDPELQRILKAHVDAMGGWRAWNKVESIRLTGTIEREGQTYDFCIIKKRPDQIRATITMSLPGNKDEEIQLIRAYDGKKAWTASRMAGSEIRDRMPIASEYLHELRAEAFFESLLISLWQDSANLKLITKVPTIHGNEHYTVSAVKDMHHNYIFRLCKNSYKIKSFTYCNESGDKVNTKLYAYNNVNGLEFSMGATIDCSKQGITNLEIKAIELGVGIYEEYFYK